MRKLREHQRLQLRNKKVVFPAKGRNRHWMEGVKQDVAQGID